MAYQRTRISEIRTAQATRRARARRRARAVAVTVIALAVLGRGVVALASDLAPAAASALAWARGCR